MKAAMNRQPGTATDAPLLQPTVFAVLQFQSAGKVKFLQDCKNCKLQIAIYTCRNPQKNASWTDTVFIYRNTVRAEKARLQERYKSDIGKLRDGYQKEIEAAIRRAETAEQHSKEKDAVIDKQRKQIDQLDRKANPQRYSLSSGAELVRINVSNYRNPSLHIWTRVGEELFENTKFQIDYDVAQRHFNGQITDEEFVNAVFEPQEQVSGKQADLL